jgi:hypothetical protein
MEMLESLLPDRNLVEILKSIKATFEKKKNITKELKKIKGKILIDHQIIEETKRKQNETEDYYKENIKESEELINNKDEYIKIFEKKLKEVEIYVHKNVKNKEFAKYKDFKMNDFTEKNTELVYKQIKLNKNIDEIRDEISRLKLENREYEENNSEDLEFRKVEKKKNFLKMYKNQCKVIEMRIKLMKNYFNNSYLFIKSSN